MHRKPSSESLTLSRRLFLGAAASSTSLPISAQSPVTDAVVRSERAYRIRVEAARTQRDVPQSQHPTNGDEQRFPNQIGSYSKGLPHNDAGEVDSNAYRAFIAALTESASQ